MEIDNSILVAVITGVFAVMGNLVISNNARRKEAEARAVRDAITSQRLESIEKKLDVHNGYAEKFGDIACEITEIKTELKGLKQ